MQQTIPANDGYIASHVGTTPSTGPFAVDFPFFSLNDVVVTREADGVFVPELLIRGADYDLTGVSTDDGSFSSGSITLYLAVSNSTVVRARTTPVERLSNFPLQGFFSRLALNAELNRITVWMQELHGLLGSTTEASTAHAPIVSPLFVGDPRGPTPAPGDNDSSLATTAFVQNAMVGVGAAVPSGTVVDFAGAVAPPGWLMCQGQTVSKTTYAGLWTAIGATYNVGGEAGTDFRLPDLRGRVVAGIDSGGSNRLNVQLASSTVVGSAGGTQDHTLSVNEMPNHGHSIQDQTHGHSVSGNFATGNNRGEGAFSGYDADVDPTRTLYMGTSVTPSYSNISGTNPNGGSLAHTSLQPTMVMNKIIKT